MAATLEQARGAKDEALKVFSRFAPVVGIGIARVGDGYGLKINLREPPDGKLKLPESVAGVPVRTEVVGAVRKR